MTLAFQHTCMEVFCDNNMNLFGLYDYKAQLVFMIMKYEAGAINARLAN